MTTTTGPPVLQEVTYKGYDPQITRRLFSLLGPYRWKFSVAILLMLISSAAAIAGPYLVMIAIDEGMGTGSIAVLRQTALFYLAVAIIQWVSTYLRVNLMAQVGQSIIYDLRSQLFTHLQALSLSFYSHFSVGRVITRVINDVGVLREFITWALLAVARDLFALVGIVIVMLGMNLRLSLLTFTVIPIMIFITTILKRYARENYRQVRAAISWVNSVLAENINGVRVVQAFSREKINYQLFRDVVNQNNLDTNLRAARIASAFPAMIDLLGGLATAMVVWLGGLAVINSLPESGDAITPGILVAFLLYIGRFFDPIRDLSRRYDSFQSTMAGSERIFALMDTPVEVEDAENAKKLPEIIGDIELQNVSFYYQDQSQSEEKQLVLQDIDMRVQAGQTVALVGKTGAGKSTLIKLIARFHDPTQGRVVIDGIDLREVTQESLRSQMGIVLQDPFLFNGTVAENIRFGRLEASDTEVQTAALAVGADQFIQHLPEGYHSRVEEGGAILSVGQRQLISFARALLADPKILILDEATSSVDTQTERIIQQALARLLDNRTSFVIAHRLSTVINADIILVIKEGRIVEQGNHSDLMALGGTYYQLYASGFEE
ncbi:MAG: ABC transporter ATP-binding protein [Chloroflexota bacterium]|nr:MAG: ABC transporter ATP-binding protein [Chloroflexota bacterium]